MSLSDYFDDGLDIPLEKQENNNRNKMKIKQNTITKFEPNEDIENILLLDVRYNRLKNCAECLFYHEKTRSIYMWFDNTGHKPYFFTSINIDKVAENENIMQSKEFLKIKKTKKYNLLKEKEVELTKIYGQTPLSIGGIPGRSLRDFISPAYEADIRYHFNYIADMQLTPGAYYSVRNGKLIDIRSEIVEMDSKELLNAFENEIEEEKEMVKQYIPILFQNIPDIYRVAFDIEVESKKNKLPNPTRAEFPIISIATVDNLGKKICWILYRDIVNQPFEFKDIEIRKFKNESDLLIDFFEAINYYPLVLSFNGDNFDCPYIVNRALKLGIKNEDIPFKLTKSGTFLENSIHIDLYLFFRQASIRLYAFSGRYDRSSLDELSIALLGEGKIDHPEVWINEMNLELLVYYNVKDAELTLNLSKFDDNITLNLMLSLMRITKMPIFEFTRLAVSRWLKMWIIYEHRKRNFLVPLKEEILSEKGKLATSSAIINGKKFQGAIVLDPKPGIWWDVHVLDFASLYPSIIKSHNLSYETIRCNHKECKSNIVPEVGHWICTKRHGMFAILLGTIRDTRVKWFKPRSSDSNLPEIERKKSKVIQSSLKVLINAGYGVLGSENFDFYCPPVAESTTAFARDAIKSIKKFVEYDLKIPVLYGDTDSIFVYKPTPQDVKNIKQWSLKHIGISLGTDYEFRYVVFSDRKKNYFGITKNGGVIVKGLMGKKSNTPEIIKDTFNKILEILKNINDPNDLENAKNKIFTTLQNLVYRINKKQFELSDVSFRLVLSRNIKDYTTWTQNLQVLSQLINENIISLNDIQSGDSLEFVKINKPIPVKIPPGLSLPPGETKYASVMPVQLAKINDVSSKALIEISKSTFEPIIYALNISWNKIIGETDLNDFF